MLKKENKKIKDLKIIKIKKIYKRVLYEATFKLTVCFVLDIESSL